MAINTIMRSPSSSGYTYRRYAHCRGPPLLLGKVAKLEVATNLGHREN